MLFLLFALITIGPAVLGLCAALVVRVAQRSRHVAPAGPSRAAATIAALVAIMVSAALNLWMASPVSGPLSGSLDGFRTQYMLRFLLPLVLGLLILAVSSFRAGTDGRETPKADAAEHAPTLVRPWWVIALSLVAAAVIVPTVVLGVNSDPDSAGRYLLHTVQLGAASSSTTIYGWYFSLPGLLLVVAVLAVAGVVLTRLSREGRSAPTQRVRELRAQARVVAAAAGGALLLHLSMVLTDLGEFVSSLHVEFSEGQGAMLAGDPSEPSVITLSILSLLATVLGYALWWLIVLSAVRPAASRVTTADRTRPRADQTASRRESTGSAIPPPGSGA